VHDLALVDLIRERLDVTYQQAMTALDETQGDVVAALALLEGQTRGGLQAFEEQAKEGVRRGLVEQLSLIRWRILGQPVAEASVALVGAGAVVVGLLALLISSSTVDTAYASGERGTSDHQPPEESFAEVTNG
jgi:repressor of nif and glnA expression